MKVFRASCRRPSDSPAPLDHGSGLPLPAAYLGVDASSVRSHFRGVGRPRAHPRAHGASESDDRVSVSPDGCRGGTWASQVPGLSSCCVPWSNTPPGAVLPRPDAGTPPSPSRHPTRSAPGMVIVFVAEPHGPHARVTTHRRTRCRARRKSRFRLDGLGPSPGGVRTRWTTL